MKSKLFISTIFLLVLLGCLQNPKPAETKAMNTPTYSIASIPTSIKSPTNLPTTTAIGTDPPPKLTGRIAFISNANKNYGESGILVMDLSTRKSDMIFELYIDETKSPFPIWWESWSPGGKDIALSDGRNLISINIDTSTITKVSYSPENIGSISEIQWSPTGDYIVYVEQKYPNYRMTSDFVLVSSNGSDSRKITFTDGNELHPTWSPNGQEIAYVYEDEILDAFVPNDFEASERLEELQYRKIFVMDRDGKNKKQLFEFSSRIDSLAWSPTGERFVFVSGKNNCGDLFIITVDGQGLRELGTFGCSESASWSPDGRYIIYAGQVGQDSDRRYGKWQVYAIDTLTDEIIQLTNNTKWKPFLPIWSK